MTNYSIANTRLGKSELMVYELSFSRSLKEELCFLEPKRCNQRAAKEANKFRS